MRKLKGYTLDKILADDFTVGQFFILIEYIKKEADETKKQMNKNKKGK